MTTRRAAVIGGGVGGLAAALALRLRGWEVVVLERAGEIAEVGAGLQISPNGVRALDALGLGDATRRAGHAPEAVEMRLGRSGRRVFRMRLKDVAERRWGRPYLQLHRADLIELIRARLEDAAPGAIHLGAEAVGLEPRGAVTLANGDVIEADVIVGADGVRSFAREALFGVEAPRYTGAVAWRATVPAECLPAGSPDGVRAWSGEGAHAVTYPLRGGALVNFVGVIETPEPVGEGWAISGAGDEARAAFGDWASPVATVVAAAERWRRWGLYDRAPLANWSKERVVLLGDACHPMSPSLAQGACQALEDALALAAVLEREETFENAFAAYEARRKPRATRVQEGARANAALFHSRGAARLLRFAPIAVADRVAPRVFHRRMDWLYGHDPEAI